MRAKRSKDARLVDKFSKQRDNLAAESSLQRPTPSTSTVDDVTHSTGGEDDDLKVTRSCLRCASCGPLGSLFYK